MTPDSVRDAAGRLRRLESFALTGEQPPDSAYDSYDAPFAHDIDDDRRDLSLAYLTLTDPTPLTVEVLVGMGFTWDEQYLLRLKTDKLTVETFTGYPRKFRFYLYGHEPSLPLLSQPRTVGELRQLLNRLG